MNQSYLDLYHIGLLAGQDGLLVGSKAAQQTVNSVCQEKLAQLPQGQGQGDSMKACEKMDLILMDFGELSMGLREQIESADQELVEDYDVMKAKLEKASQDDTEDARLKRLAEQYRKQI
jgi:hypothetical protein